MARFLQSATKLEPISLRPKRSDVAVRLTALVWLPHWKDESDCLTAARE
jgi:hypothetical protein